MKLDKMKKAVVNNPLARVLAADNDMLQHICVIRHMEDERARPGVLGSESIPKKELEEQEEDDNINPEWYESVAQSIQNVPSSVVGGMEFSDLPDSYQKKYDEPEERNELDELFQQAAWEAVDGDQECQRWMRDHWEGLVIEDPDYPGEFIRVENARSRYVRPPVKIESQLEEQKSVYMLTPLTDEAREWIDDNISPESWQWLGGGLGVEHSYIADIVDGMEEEGLKHGKDFKVESKQVREQRSTWHVIPLTNKARKWMDKNLSSESGQRVADGFEVDDRKLDGVGNQMAQAGLVHSIDFKVESKQVREQEEGIVIRFSASDVKTVAKNAGRKFTDAQAEKFLWGMGKYLTIAVMKAGREFIKNYIEEWSDPD